jgi:hypothetical protein
MSGQHRSDASPYYGNYLQQKYNRPDARATPFGRDPHIVLRKARYGKPVAQLSIRTASACIQTPPREIRYRLDLGLLIL